jgi:lipopolysaccharide transport system ATP-binding protein
MSSAIAVENLSKKYLIGHQRKERYTALRDVLANGAKRVAHKLCHPFVASENDPTQEEFWALKCISFDIMQGDRVGVIGRNGAGKSTLLKILSRITEPTTGRIRIRGRVASLMEVGTGFHPELTGRENIFLNGVILGMSKADIKKSFDEIVAFAEVEKFLDTPVKHYSSGMYVRLAFAVAAHLEPEILIVDEVLAVGDSQFQKKCLGKMESVGNEGRTILFVSHNMAAIKTLCSTGIVLNKGKMLYQGGVKGAVDQYMGQDNLDKNEIAWDDIADAPGNENIRLQSIAVKPVQGLIIDIDSGIEISTVFHNKTAVRILGLTLRMFTIEGICLFESGVVLSRDGDAKIGCYSAKVKIPPHLLNAGVYKINLVFGESQKHLLYAIEDVISFEVEHTATGRGSNMSLAPGVIRPILDWAYDFSLQQQTRLNFEDRHKNSCQFGDVRAVTSNDIQEESK